MSFSADPGLNRERNKKASAPVQTRESGLSFKFCLVFFFLSIIQKRSENQIFGFSLSRNKEWGSTLLQPCMGRKEGAQNRSFFFSQLLATEFPVKFKLFFYLRCPGCYFCSAHTSVVSNPCLIYTEPPGEEETPWLLCPSRFSPITPLFLAWHGGLIQNHAFSLLPSEPTLTGVFESPSCRNKTRRGVSCRNRGEIPLAFLQIVGFPGRNQGGKGWRERRMGGEVRELGSNEGHDRMNFLSHEAPPKETGRKNRDGAYLANRSSRSSM